MLPMIHQPEDAIMRLKVIVGKLIYFIVVRHSSNLRFKYNRLNWGRPTQNYSLPHGTDTLAGLNSIVHRPSGHIRQRIP